MEAKKNQTLKFFKKTIYFLSFFILFFAASRSLAATLNFSPSSGAKQVGKNFSVSVYVSSAEQAMNAASGNIQVSSNLEIVSVSKSGSIFSLWAQEPSFSAGAATFEGIVLNPGYTGVNGKIITVTLKPTSAGAASVEFTSAAVLANDGSGTNILTSFGAANFVVATGEEPVVAQVTTIPSAPVVISANCSAVDGWCSSNDPAFSWVLPSGVTGVSMLGNHSPTTDPGTKSDGLVSSYTYNNVEDGSWYFHIRFRNANGWGPTTHYKFQIDTKKPEFFNVSLVEPLTALDPRAQLRLQSRDGSSGIGSYEIVVDNSEAQTWIDDGSHVMQTNVLSPGLHTVVVKAKDKAGNYLTSSLEVSVEEIAAPAIVWYTQQLTTNEALTIEGRSYPNVRVVFYIYKDGTSPITQFVNTDSKGNFKFVLNNKLSEGNYTVSAKAENDAGAMSATTEKMNITVSQKTGAAGLLLGNYLVAILVVAVLILIPLVLVVYIWHRLFVLKNKVRDQVEDVEKTIHTAFDSLRESTRQQVSVLERVKLKRELTKEETKILSQLKKQLNAAEKFINKEVAKIEKSIK